MKKRGAWTGLIGALLVFAIMMTIHFNYGYRVSYKGETVGFVRDLKTVSAAFDTLSQEFQEDYGEDVIVDDLVTIRYEAASGREALVEEELAASLLENGLKPQMHAARIYVNEEAVAVVESAATAQEILNQVIQEGIVLSENDTLVEAQIMDQVTLEETLVDAWDLEEAQIVLERFKEGLKIAETYEIQPKDTLWTIAVNRGMTTEQIQSVNPNMDPSRLMPGDTIVIEQLEALFHIRYTKEVSFQESIPYQVDYTTDDTLYLGQVKVVQDGQEGILETAHLQSFEDGVQTEDVVLGSVEVKSPVTEIRAKGTQPWPAPNVTGHLVVPATGRILGMFGSDRGSHYHQGVDICQWSGSARGIYAADGGTVTAAVTEGYNGGRGLYIEISHGGGFSTAYYHLSSIQVVVGQTVRQGEQIGIMGTTGNSIGIHLHFETRVNGRAVDPNNYFGYFRNGLDLKALSW